MPGALAHNFGYSVNFGGGQGRFIGGGTGQSNPSTFTLELRFKTTTTTGDKLIGFENTKNATSTNADRHVFMRPDGRIVAGGWVNSGTSAITSTSAYNNGFTGQIDDAAVYPTQLTAARVTAHYAAR